MLSEHKIKIAFIIFPFIIMSIALLVPRSLVFILLIIGIMAFFLKKEAIKNLFSLSTNSFIAFAILIVLTLGSSLFISIEPSVSFEKWAKTLTILLSGGLAILGYKHLKLEAYNTQIIMGFLISISLASLVLIIDILSGMALMNIIKESQNFSPHYNRTATALIILATPILYFAVQEQSISTFWKVLSALLVIYAIIVSSSQGAQLALICIIIAFIYPITSKIAMRILGAVLAMLVIFSPWLCIFLYENIFQNTDVATLSWLHNAAAGNRAEIWYSLSKIILEKPFIGYGMDNVRNMDLQSPGLFWKETSVLHPHNFALQLWIEFGVFGAIIGAAITYKITAFIANISKNNYIKKAMLASFLAWLAIAATGYGIWQGWFVGLSLTLLCFWSFIVFTRKSYR